MEICGTDHHENEQADAQTVCRYLNQFGVVGKGSGYYFRKQDTAQTTDPHNNSRCDNHQPQGILHTLMLTGPVVEADDRLHPLPNTDNQHHQKHPDAGDDTVAQSQVAAILFQGVVLITTTKLPANCMAKGETPIVRIFHTTWRSSLKVPLWKRTMLSF